MALGEFASSHQLDDIHLGVADLLVELLVDEFPLVDFVPNGPYDPTIVATLFQLVSSYP